MIMDESAHDGIQNMDHAGFHIVFREKLMVIKKR